MKVRWCHTETKVDQEKLMEWLGTYSESITLCIILDEGTVDHSCYTKNILRAALKYGVGGKQIFQQDGANSHRHHLTQEWYLDNFPSFIDKDHWPLNNPDLSRLYLR